MQVYRGLPILTNQSDHPARLVGMWDLDHEASVGEYQELAHAAVDEILAAGRTPVVVGGTGLYLRATLAELELPPAPLAETRERLQRPSDPVGADPAPEPPARPGERRGGLGRFYAGAGAARAPGRRPGRARAAAAVVHPNARRRVVRALELAEAGSSLRPEQDRLWGGETRHPTLIVGLVLD